jgi:hypothetical protein
MSKRASKVGMCSRCVYRVAQISHGVPTENGYCTRYSGTCRRVVVRCGGETPSTEGLQTKMREGDSDEP